MKKRVWVLCIIACLLSMVLSSSWNAIPFAGHNSQLLPTMEDETTATRREIASPFLQKITTFHQALKHLGDYTITRPVDYGFLSWACENVSPDFADKLAKELPKNSGELFYHLFGQSLHVLWDRYTGALENSPYIHPIEVQGAVTLAFAGDVNLADDWENMLSPPAQSRRIENVLSKKLLERMRDADILLLNNEFCFSGRGSPMEDKLYTFRSSPANVHMLQDMGVDLVSLANNHAFDYGSDAFYDTLDTLTQAGIPYIGGGRNFTEAIQPQYFHAGGMKIAYLAASCAEKYIRTPPATANQPGVFYCYDDADLLESVALARQNADWVVVYPHWGTEYNSMPDNIQTDMAHRLVDAGADIVVGAHPHVLQGIERYGDRPIAYSLGNFWFNTGWVQTALLEISLIDTEEYHLRIQPCMTAGGITYLMEGEYERRTLLDHLEDISQDIVIQDDGSVVFSTISS